MMTGILLRELLLAYWGHIVYVARSVKSSYRGASDPPEGGRKGSGSLPGGPKIP